MARTSIYCQEIYRSYGWLELAEQEDQTLVLYKESYESADNLGEWHQVQKRQYQSLYGLFFVLF